MKRFTTLLFTLLAFAGCDRTESPRQVEDFNFDWCFILGDNEAYASPEYSDSTWRSLHLPHDWAIEGCFSKENPSTASGGALPGGIGWYRKCFTAPTGHIVNLEFDGIFMNSTVWVNGHKVGHRPYGYSSFSYDITPYLHDGDNLVAVRCDNSEQPNSRWYAGCGIYRDVRLVATAPIFVEYSGVFVTTPVVTEKQATVNITTTLTSKESVTRQVIVRHRILNDASRCVCETTAEAEIVPGTSIEIAAEGRLRRPRIWDPEHPELYTLHTTIEQQGLPTDDYFTRFGVRSFEFTPDRGLVLNGRQLKILGVCMHHDMGALGAAVHRRALERQLEILHGMGCNAIRTSHNPPSPLLLDLCDSMGFIVMDEALDMWRKRKTTYDYARFFDQWHERDVQDFVRRDRNHPSVLMWSVGNEILEQWDSSDADELADDAANLMLNFRSKLSPTLADENNPNVLLAHHMVDLVKQLDTTRPVTAGCNDPRTSNNLLRSGAFDIIGINYHGHLYDSIPVWYPGQSFIGSETVSSIQSRGFYLHPSSKEQVQPLDWRIPYQTPHQQCSAYDHSRVPWGATHEKSWIEIRDRDFAAGTFVWTGFDYLGEPTPYGWPSRSSYFGIVDLCGFPKDVYYMYRAEWSEIATLHLYPHWNWAEGDKIDLWVYYNAADQVELLVNGRSLGRQSKNADRLHCLWTDVLFEPGEITAVAYKEGREVRRTTHRTAGEPAAMQLTADRIKIASDGYDLAFITVEVVDAEGNTCPTASAELHFAVEGVGELFGVDNGNAAQHLSLKGDRMPLFNGKALAIVRSLRGQRGDIRLTVTDDKEHTSEICLKAR